jgi:hypothetical protein
MVRIGREIDAPSVIDGKQVVLQTSSIAEPARRQNRCMLILLLSAAGALTLCRCADKKPHFLRQAVNFASRNGRSATH